MKIIDTCLYQALAVSHMKQYVYELSLRNTCVNQTDCGGFWSTG